MNKTTRYVTLGLLVLALIGGGAYLLKWKDLPKNLRGGCWTEQHRYIAFGEYDGKPIIWRILEAGETYRGEPVAFLLAENAVTEMKFYSLSRYNYGWNSSDIKRWLNDDFYHAAFSEKERDAIVNSAYCYGGEYKGSSGKDTYKVFLLSVDDAKNQKFFANDADRAIEDYWWLRSPGKISLCAASVNYGGGFTDLGNFVYDLLAVRPALKINLASSIFTSSSSKYEILYPVTVEVRDEARAYPPIRGASVAADSPKQGYATGDNGIAELKLGVGNQTIQVSVAGGKTREITLDVEPGIGITVDLRVEKSVTQEWIEFLDSYSTYKKYRKPTLGSEETKRLIAAGADVNAPDSSGRTALVLVLSTGGKWDEPYFEIVKALIAAGADVNAPDSRGQTPLVLALSTGSIWYELDLEIVKALIEAGADVNARDPDSGWTALLEAAAHSLTEAAKVLLLAGADVNAPDSRGRTPLMLASSAGSEWDEPGLEIVKALIEAGADVNARSLGDDWTALIEAVVGSHAETAEILLRAGADVNAPDSCGRTPLMLALSTSGIWYEPDLKIVSALIEAGADVNIRDAEGRRALDYARNNEDYEEFTNFDVFKIIEEKTAD